MVSTTTTPVEGRGYRRRISVVETIPASMQQTPAARVPPWTPPRLPRASTGSWSAPPRPRWRAAVTAAAFQSSTIPASMQQKPATRVPPRTPVVHGAATPVEGRSYRRRISVVENSSQHAAEASNSGATSDPPGAPPTPAWLILERALVIVV